MKRVLAVALVLALGFSVAGFAAKVGIVYDYIGLGDLAVNDMAHLGAERAAIDFGVGLVGLQSYTAEDYLPNIRTLAATGEYDLILCPSFQLIDALSQAAWEFPSQRFAIIDSVVDQPNVMSVLFRENESSALVGCLAGLLASQQGYRYVGMVLGIEMPVMYHFEAGFRFGVDWGLKQYVARGYGIPQDVGMLCDYADSFDDIALGKTNAQAQLAQGAGSIFSAAWKLGIGMLDAVEEAHLVLGTTTAPTEAPYFFGSDADQDWMKNGLYGLASGMKRVDNACYLAVQSVVDGTFHGGTISLGLREDGVGLSNRYSLIDALPCAIQTGMITASDSDLILANWEANRAAVPSFIWGLVEDLQAGILNGSIVVPTANTRAEMDAVRAAYPLSGSPGTEASPQKEPTAPTDAQALPKEFVVGHELRITLTAFGGSGETLEWYSGACGGEYVGQGTSLTIDAPQTTTEYYARWRNVTGVSACAEVTVTVQVPQRPSAPTSVSASPDRFTAGSVNLVELSASGGGGPGARLNWYSAGCGENGEYLLTYLIAPPPSKTTTYCAQWENMYGLTSDCACVTVTVDPCSTPVPPSVVTASPDKYVEGLVDRVRLEASGGSGGTLEWYKDSCGEDCIGTGSPLTVTPPCSSTTYYARWKNVCGVSACARVAVTVIPEEAVPTAPDSASASPQVFTVGYCSSIRLSAAGGRGDALEWYRDKSQRDLVGRGNDLEVPAPGETTTYYACWRIADRTSDNASTTVTVREKQGDILLVTLDYLRFSTTGDGSLLAAKTGEAYFGAVLTGIYPGGTYSSVVTEFPCQKGGWVDIAPQNDQNGSYAALPMYLGLPLYSCSWDERPKTLALTLQAFDDDAGPTWVDEAAGFASGLLTDLGTFVQDTLNLPNTIAADAVRKAIGVDPFGFVTSLTDSAVRTFTRDALGTDIVEGAATLKFYGRCSVLAGSLLDVVRKSLGKPDLIGLFTEMSSSERGRSMLTGDFGVGNPPYQQRYSVYSSRPESASAGLDLGARGVCTTTVRKLPIMSEPLHVTVTLSSARVLDCRDELGDGEVYFDTRVISDTKPSLSTTISAIRDSLVDVFPWVNLDVFPATCTHWPEVTKQASDDPGAKCTAPVFYEGVQGQDIPFGSEVVLFDGDIDTFLYLEIEANEDDSGNSLEDAVDWLGTASELYTYDELATDRNFIQVFETPYIRLYVEFVVQE